MNKGRFRGLEAMQGGLAKKYPKQKEPGNAELFFAVNY
jgi:hypothetical protein